MESLATALPNVFSEVTIQSPEQTYIGSWLANFYHGYLDGILNSPATNGGANFDYGSEGILNLSDIDACI